MTNWSPIRLSTHYQISVFKRIFGTSGHLMKMMVDLELEIDERLQISRNKLINYEDANR